MKEFVSQNPEYDVFLNNCEDFAKALARKIIDGSYPTVVKPRGAVYPVSSVAMADIFVEIEKELGYDEAVIYLDYAGLAKGSGLFDINEFIKNKKLDKSRES